MFLVPGSWGVCFGVCSTSRFLVPPPTQSLSVLPLTPCVLVSVIECSGLCALGAHVCLPSSCVPVPVYLSPYTRTRTCTRTCPRTRNRPCTRPCTFSPRLGSRWGCGGFLSPHPDPLYLCSDLTCPQCPHPPPVLCRYGQSPFCPPIPLSSAVFIGGVPPRPRWCSSMASPWSVVLGGAPPRCPR